MFFSSLSSKILTFNLEAINAACSPSLEILRKFFFNGVKRHFAIINETSIPKFEIVLQ